MRTINTIMLSVLLLSCHRDELVEASAVSSDIVVELDWSNMSERPSGMSLLFYPTSGGEPYSLSTNSVSSALLSLPCGGYNILVFNQIPADFGTLSFTGMNSFYSAEVYTLASSRSGSVELVEELAAATYLDYRVTPEQVRTSVTQLSQMGASEPTDTLSLKPIVVVREAQVRVNIDGIASLSSASASLTGMAEGYNFSQQLSHTGSVSHMLSDWSIEDYSVEVGQGVITTTFVTFGLTGWSTTTRNEYGWSGDIELDMLLADGSTAVSHSASLDSRIRVEDNTEHMSTTIFIELGFGADDDDTPPSLPDVSGEGDDSASGFSADVEPWGEEENYDLSY